MRLRAGTERRGREIEWSKNRIAEDGSLFAIAKTKPYQIARSVLENVGLARTRNICNALTQAVEAAELKAREKSKQAGWVGQSFRRFPARGRLGQQPGDFSATSSAR